MPQLTPSERWEAVQEEIREVSPPRNPTFVRRHGETAREYTERVAMLDRANFDAMDELQNEFGLSHSAVRSLILASGSFNARFSFEQWKSRIERGADGCGARNWLKRRYKLSDEIADQVVAGFEAGDDRALLEALTFEQLVHRLLNEHAQTELEKAGALGELGAATQ